MSVTLSPPMYLQFFTAAGVPAFGYQLFTYIAGTSTKQATWLDSTQTSQNSNPIVLDSQGAAYVWLDPTLTYKFVLALPNDTDPPTGSVRSVDNIQSPITAETFASVVTAALIGSVLYPRTAAEIAASVTPVDYAYPPNHIFRYITDIANVLAGTSTYDNSAGAQNWLTTLTVGCTAILIGTVRAQGLVLRINDVHFTGGGWLKPISNVSATILQLGEDSSSTPIVRATGEINIGDSGGSVSSWPSVTGLAVQQATGCRLGISAVGLGTGIVFNPTQGAAAYNVFLLGSMFNNTLGLQFNATDPGYCNENTFIGGRWTINSGTWTSSVIYVQGLKTGTNGVNNIKMLSPSFEGSGQVLDWNGESLIIENARWEPIATGTAGTNFATVFWNFGSSSGRNHVGITLNTQWLSGNQTKSYSSGLTMISTTQFQIAGSDQTAFFPRMQLISVTVSGTTYLCDVMFSHFDGTNTQVYILNPIVTAGPTTVVTPRLNDAGLVNTIAVALADAGGTWQAKASYNRFITLIDSAFHIAGGGGYAALTLSDQSSSSNDVLRVIDFPGTGAKSAALTCQGSLTLAKSVGVNGASAPSQSTGWGTPVGGAVISSYNITDAGGANSNTNKCVAQIIAYLKSKGDFGA